MTTIPMMFAEISSTNTNPSTVVAATLAAVSTSLVIWKAVHLRYRLRIARKSVEEVEHLASSERVWEVREKQSGELTYAQIDRVNSAVKLLSKIDLESYLIDSGTRNRIDNSLAMLKSQLPDNNEERKRR